MTFHWEVKVKILTYFCEIKCLHCSWYLSPYIHLSWQFILQILNISPLSARRCYYLCWYHLLALKWRYSKMPTCRSKQRLTRQTKRAAPCLHPSWTSAQRRAGVSGRAYSWPRPRPDSRPSSPWTRTTRRHARDRTNKVRESWDTPFIVLGFSHNLTSFVYSGFPRNWKEYFSGRTN